MNFQALKTAIFLLLFLYIPCLWAQKMNEGEVPSQRSRLQEIRQDIEKYKKELQSKEKKESTELDMLAALDHEVDITSGMVRSLNKEIRRYARQISAREKDIQVTEKQLARVREKFAHRLTSFYKYGRVHDLELLLDSKSLAQTRVWLTYAKSVADNDRRTYKSILKKKQSLEANRDLLQLEIAEKQKAIQLKSKEEKRLKKSRRERHNYLQQLRKDKEFLKQKLAERERAAQQISRLIVEAESQRANRERAPVGIDDVDFSTLKGHMMWPAKGKIIMHFGKQRHPQLKTITENLGIEIKAPYGSAVQAVDDGEVWTITWQRGRGNIIIISHDNGYYTVYTHLAEIRVELHEYVSRGQVIGTVGDTGSLNGAVLHFQIWKNTTNLNPEEWLG